MKRYGMARQRREKRNQRLQEERQRQEKRNQRLREERPIQTIPCHELIHCVETGEGDNGYDKDAMIYELFLREENRVGVSSSFDLTLYACHHYATECEYCNPGCHKHKPAKIIKDVNSPARISVSERGRGAAHYKKVIAARIKWRKRCRDIYDQYEHEVQSFVSFSSMFWDDWREWTDMDYEYDDRGNKIYQVSC